MTIYDTQDDLRSAVQQRIRQRLSDDEWDEVRPYWSEPYENGDVKEIARLARERFGKSPRAGRSKVRKSERRKAVGELQRYYWYADWVFQAGFPDYRDRRAKNLEALATGVRETLGLHNPVRLCQLREVLMGLGAEESPPGLRIPYPRRPDDGDCIDVCCLYYDWRKKEVLHNVCRLAEMLANQLGWHPAEAIAFVFCSKNPLSADVPRVYRQGKEITIKVPLDAKPEALARMYSRARTGAIREIRGVTGKTARPRRASVRVQTLLDFCIENPELKGDRLRTAWNSRYPDWQYGSAESLNAVVSRAAKRELRRMDSAIG